MSRFIGGLFSATLPPPGPAARQDNMVMTVLLHLIAANMCGIDAHSRSEFLNLLSRFQPCAHRACFHCPPPRKLGPFFFELLYRRGEFWAVKKSYGNGSYKNLTKLFYFLGI